MKFVCQEMHCLGRNEQGSSYAEKKNVSHPLKYIPSTLNRYFLINWVKMCYISKKRSYIILFIFKWRVRPNALHTEPNQTNYVKTHQNKICPSHYKVLFWFPVNKTFYISYVALFLGTLCTTWNPPHWENLWAGKLHRDSVCGDWNQCWMPPSVILSISMSTHLSVHL